jgi:hypothetical protein
VLERDSYGADPSATDCQVFQGLEKPSSAWRIKSGDDLLDPSHDTSIVLGKELRLYPDELLSHRHSNYTRPSWPAWRADRRACDLRSARVLHRLADRREDFEQLAQLLCAESSLDWT